MLPTKPAPPPLTSSRPRPLSCCDFKVEAQLDSDLAKNSAEQEAEAKHEQSALLKQQQQDAEQAQQAFEQKLSKDKAGMDEATRRRMLAEHEAETQAQEAAFAARPALKKT